MTSAELRDSGYLDLLYGTLFQPVRTFQRIEGQPDAETRYLFYALISVVLISTIAPVVHMANVGGDPGDLVMAMPFSAVLGVLVWGFMAMVVSFLSYAFTGQTRIRTVLILSGLATLPWLLMGPVSLLKIGLGMPGLIAATVLGMGIWLWTSILFAMALVITYHMTAERVMIILVMPFVMMLVFLGWVVGFITNITSLYPFY
jgi:hypothetical protein